MHKRFFLLTIKHLIRNTSLFLNGIKTAEGFSFFSAGNRLCVSMLRNECAKFPQSNDAFCKFFAKKVKRNGAQRSGAFCRMCKPESLPKPERIVRPKIKSPYQGNRRLHVEHSAVRLEDSRVHLQPTGHRSAKQGRQSFVKNRF
jgi:hypothetical protein